MKHLTVLFTFSLLLFTSSAALPIHWDVELTAQPPQVFTLQRPRGETYELEAVLKRHGKPFEQAITNACIYWQTNGMENLYWSAPASVSNNVLRATWLPSMDPGATNVRGYIGDPGHIYAAAFQFRFIASPGALPNELPLPQKVIDFAKVTVLNPPWSGGGGGGVDTNAVRDIVRPMIGEATNGIPEQIAALQDGKRDNTDLAVYAETNLYTRWVWSDPYHEAPEGFIEAANSTDAPQPFWDENIWNVNGEIDGHTVGDGVGDESSTNVVMNVYDGSSVMITRERYRGIAPTGEQIVRGLNDDGMWSISVSQAQYASDSGLANEAEYANMADHDGYGNHIADTYATKNELSSSISTNNPEFVSAVRALAPTTIRTYDSVRQCWWVLEMVNGVPTWTVED